MVQPKEKVIGAFRILSPAYNTPCRMQCSQAHLEACQVDGCLIYGWRQW